MLSFSFTVPPTPPGLKPVRADRLVREAAPRQVSRAAVAECFALRRVTLAGSGVALGKSDVPPAGARIDVQDLAEDSDRRVAPEPESPLCIVWEEAGIVAVDKPAGQPCHPLSPEERGTLAGALVARFPEMAAVGSDALQPGIIHRIDAGTSGLVLAARSQEAFDAVKAQFASQKVRKTYLALVHGAVDAPGGVSGFLAHCSSFRGRMRAVAAQSLPRGERPLRAETFWTPLARVAPDATLLKVEIRTGVTHQIRCHLSCAGHPVAGDTLYGGAPHPASPRGGHCLHSLSAEFALPGAGGEEGRTAKVSVPLPPWAAPLAQMKRGLP